ncbi:MAG: LysR family transcriptional regulator [Brevundimonas sp. 32-68-21]|nr:MAG: LysR family transcriptional regulator [Brevundimonas sp. 32-68-21]
MLPTLRQLQYLKLLAEHGSFSRAAEAAHVSQPALSAGVQELERILGAPVVERARGAVIMTAVGVEAVRRAEDVLARTEDLVEAAKNAGRMLSGRFRLGVIPTVAPFLLPAKLPSLKAAYPSLKLYIREDLTPRLIAALKAGQIDAAVIALPYEAPGIEHARIGDDVFAATSLHTLVQMVGSGLGVSFLPKMAVQAGLADTPSVVIRAFENQADGAPPHREIVVAWRAGSSRAAEARLLAEALKLD